MVSPAYREVCPVRCRVGIHFWTLEGLAPLGAFGLRVDGLDPGVRANWSTLKERYRDGSSEIELVVNHPDVQTAHDIATIARQTIWQGRELWPGRELPIAQVHNAAQAIREWEQAQTRTRDPESSSGKTA